MPEPITSEAMFQALRGVHRMYVKQQITLLNALKDKFGPEAAETVERANAQEVCRAYLSQAGGERSIDDLIALLWEPLRAQGYEFTVERQENGAQIRCTACPFATLYKNLGGAEWGYRLYCAADSNLVEGFNPEIGFKRTQTLMEGHNCCDHYYYVK